MRKPAAKSSLLRAAAATPPTRPVRLARTPPSSLLAEVGRRVRAAREARTESRAGLAARSGLSLRFLAQLEAGRANISLLRLSEVARALDTDLNTLVAGTEMEVARIEPLPPGIHELLQGRSAAELRDLEQWLRDRPSSRAVVALLGLRGAGKSTVGLRLARTLRVPFYELDSLIEAAAGLSLEQIFELQGEGYYRRLEREVLGDFLAHHRDGVLATGGGLVTSSETYADLRRHCTTVWLRADPEEHWQRVVRQGDRRPMRDNPGAMRELRALWTERAPLYARADHTIDTSARSPQDVVRATQEWIRARRSQLATKVIAPR